MNGCYMDNQMVNLIHLIQQWSKTKIGYITNFLNYPLTFWSSQRPCAVYINTILHMVFTLHTTGYNISVPWLQVGINPLQLPEIWQVLELNPDILYP